MHTLSASVSLNGGSGVSNVGTNSTYHNQNEILFKKAITDRSEVKSDAKFTTKRPTNLSLRIIPGNGSQSVNENDSDHYVGTSNPASGKDNRQSQATAAPEPNASVIGIKRHDIGFKDLSYTAKTGILKREYKTILEEVSGNFKAGDLTAIMGPSGSGKTTLLNILSGYTTQNITGQITINDCERDLKRFSHQSAYIMQDHDMQPHLTVLEAMHFAANLKLGNEMCKESKRARIYQILEAIGIKESRKTKTLSLSGGQKKRLSIALELVNNPPIMLLDEPTSGLDSSTSTQCVSLLKKLAQEGRTIICTIHQPSALVFGMFDHLFALAEGKCIFSGSSTNVVPFLADLGLRCPEYHNPSDYLLEIATNDYGLENPRLVEKIKNGKCDLYRKTRESTAQVEAMAKVERMMEAGLITPVKAPVFSLENQPQKQSTTLTPIMEMSSSILYSKENSAVQYSIVNDVKNQKSCKLKIVKPSIQLVDPSKFCKKTDRYATSFWRQLSLLLTRTFLILWRDKSLTRNRLLIHIIMACFVGVLYFRIGNDASNTLNNMRYVFFSIMFLMYTAFSSITLNFPLEFPVVSREYFNRWYSLRAYYVAITLADVPIQLACTLTFVLISYLMTNQPLEVFRCVLFFIMCFLATLVAQSIGLVVGAFFDVKNGAIFGPFFICPFLIFSGFFIQMRHVNDMMRWLFHISFLKHALQGSMLAIFGYERPKLECDEIFCQFIRPERFLQTMDMKDGSYLFAALSLIGIFFILRLIAFAIMSFRLGLIR